MKSFILISLFSILAIHSFAQTPEDKFNKAKEQYENGKFAECITQLQSIEKQVGANPKIYSLYINAYLKEKDYINSKIALNKFKKLIGSKTSESIQAILSLEKEIDNGVNTSENNSKETLQKKRMQEADKIITSLKQFNQQQKNTFQSNFDKMQSNILINTNSREELVTNIANSSEEQKRKVYKLLEQTKTPKINIELIFEDEGKNENIKKYSYEKYTDDGILTFRYNFDFSDSPLKFSEAMLTEDYAVNIIGKKIGAKIEEEKLISKNGDYKRVERKSYIIDKFETKQLNSLSQQLVYKNMLLKDTLTVYEANISDKYYIQYNYDENYRITSSFRKTISNKNDRIIGYYKSNYTYPSPSELIIKDEENQKPMDIENDVNFKGLNGNEGYKIERRILKIKLNTWGYFRSIIIGTNMPLFYKYEFDLYARPIYTKQFYEISNKIKDIENKFNLIQYQDGYQSGYDYFYFQMALKKYYSFPQDFSSVINYLNKTLEYNPKNLDALNIKAYCYYYLNQFDEAIQQLNNALQINPNYSNAYDTMGELYFLKGDKEKALEFYKKAASMGDENSIDWLMKNGY